MQLRTKRMLSDTIKELLQEGVTSPQNRVDCKEFAKAIAKLAGSHTVRIAHATEAIGMCHDPATGLEWHGRSRLLESYVMTAALTKEQVAQRMRDEKEHLQALKALGYLGPTSARWIGVRRREAQVFASAYGLPYETD